MFQKSSRIDSHPRRPQLPVKVGPCCQTGHPDSSDNPALLDKIAWFNQYGFEVIVKAEKAGEIPEDDSHRIMDEVQKLTDEYTGKVDDLLKAKEEEIMEI